MPRTKQGNSRPKAKTRTPGAALTPEVRSLLDNVLVPALVREYLAELGPQKSLALGDEVKANFAPESRLRTKELK